MLSTVRGGVAFSLCTLSLLVCIAASGTLGGPAASAAATGAGIGPAGSWYFAVSGDSRDCGDLIMPKIAQSIRDNAKEAPAAFYWHLGDFRRMFDIDCDIAKRKDPAYDCVHRDPSRLSKSEMSGYTSTAWDDFIEHQLKPFGATPVFIGLGNHELYGGKARSDVRQKFQHWLAQAPINAQRAVDRSKGISSNDGDTYYHFVKNGLDFISLDNADGKSFDSAQILWLAKVLNMDAHDASIKTIIAGMHEALPYSRSRDHAMDMTCQGICSGGQVYDMLFRAQHLGAPQAEQKHVYVFCSHSHYFQEDIFNTPEHTGQVLTGWLVGTAGAEQYTETIRYGYLEVEVQPDGTLHPRFRDVTRDSAPLASGPGADELTNFCFQDNKRGHSPNDMVKTDCACGAVK
jgi:hypothetical protein